MHCDGQTLTLMGIFVICCNGLVLLSEAKREFPNGLSPKLMPTQEFDDDAPLCSTREACGFYSFNLKSRSLRWIKSWCKCSDEQECVYDKTDLKMRVYRQICVSQNEETSEENTTEEEEQNKDHQHLLATRSRRALMFLNKFKF